MEKFEILHSNSEFYKEIKKTLKSAKKSIYLETYIFKEDEIGIKIRNILSEKAKEGLKVKVLLDGFGTLKNSELFFFEFIQNGGGIRFFHRLFWSWWLMQKIIMRNHRKLLIIDEKITYIGSSNIDQNTIDWLELDIKINDEETAKKFEEYFEQNFEIANKNFFKQRKINQSTKLDSLEIIEDSPSLIQSHFRHAVYGFLQKSEKEIMIESPYVIFDRSTLELFERAAKRKVKITAILPEDADHKIVDILNKRCMAEMVKRKINIRTFSKNGLHSKMMIVDKKEFIFGSSNLDYMSFFMLFEINLKGDNPDLLGKLIDHFERTLKDTRPFDLKTWEKRPFYVKIIDIVLYKVRFLF